MTPSLVKEKLGNLSDFPVGDRTVDHLPLEWFETGKRILHGQTSSGRRLVLRFLKEAPNLCQGDVLFADTRTVVAVDIRPCACIVLRPATLYEMAYACYEIGNRHLPLYYDDGVLLMPFDAPVCRLLEGAGLRPVQEQRRLLQPLRTSVAAHPHNGSTSLFSRILQIASPHE